MSVAPAIDGLAALQREAHRSSDWPPNRLTLELVRPILRRFSTSRSLPGPG